MPYRIFLAYLANAEKLRRWMAGNGLTLAEYLQQKLAGMES